MSDISRPKKWLGYYSRKRIIHQWTQIALLTKVPVEKVLEVGPAMGGVTAMLQNAGYDVTTLDRQELDFESPKVPNLHVDLMDISAEGMSGHDAIICCETLEHVKWMSTDIILKKFNDSGAKYLILSVPYMGFQTTFEFYFNPHRFYQYFSMKKFNSLKTFKYKAIDEHEWEVGYKGYSLAAWEAKFALAGYKIIEREFTAQCRSVFHLLERVEP